MAVFETWLMLKKSASNSYSKFLCFGGSRITFMTILILNNFFRSLFSRFICLARFITFGLVELFIINCSVSVYRINGACQMENTFLIPIEQLASI